MTRRFPRRIGFGASALALLAGACTREPWATQGAATAAAAPAALPADFTLRYPEAPRADQVDVLHGVPIPDPWRSLEDLDAPATRAWVEAEDALARDYLARLPAREALRQRLVTLWNFERFGVPVRRGDRVFFTHNTGLEEQARLLVAGSPDAEPRVLLDPNLLSPDATLALTGVAPSEDGRLLAYALSASGSDWKEWRIREVETGRDLEDRVRWSKFSDAAWTHDGAGFFYARYDEPAPGVEGEAPNQHQKLYYHRAGTPQERDSLVYARPDQPEWGFGPEVSEDGRWLVIRVWRGARPENGIFVKDLARADAPVVELLADFDARWSFVGSRGSLFYFHTDLRAPRGRVLAIELGRPERSAWTELIPQKPDVLQSVSFVQQRFVAQYLRDGWSRASVYLENGEFVRTLELPGLGSLAGFAGRRDDRETFFHWTGFATPGTVYRHDLETGETRVWRAPRVDFDPAAFETQQVFATSRDGTRIPLFLVHRAGLAPDGGRPVLLTGYGGFGVPLTPHFSARNLAWLELGGVVAQPILRGGGEYGRAWHQAGRGSAKQNVFDDFLAAAQWLVANGWTRPERLAIAGTSNGGLLVAAALVQRPELFGAVHANVGVLDMLRFHRFTIGWAWAEEYGSPEDPASFAVLRAYSPLHNLREGTRYPATLVTTADHDDRVFPAHSFKFAAALQEAQGGSAPVLLRVESKAGHGRGTPTSKEIEAAADSLAFLVQNLSMDASALPLPREARGEGSPETAR
ncbi:MAG TPA: prolyl oligopeptidase family serine peptidase [Myxococcota bacterium]|nr:prolyl oligopeptidase family serine peptidase [Myxococcota bacterium]